MEEGGGWLTAPVSSVWGTEKPILDNHHSKVPEDDLASEDGLVE